MCPGSTEQQHLTQLRRWFLGVKCITIGTLKDQLQLDWMEDTLSRQGNRMSSNWKQGVVVRLSSWRNENEGRCGLSVLLANWKPAYSSFSNTDQLHPNSMDFLKKKEEGTPHFPPVFWLILSQQHLPPPVQLIQKLRLNVTLREESLLSDRWGSKAATCPTLSNVKHFDPDKLRQPDGDTLLLKVSYFKAFAIRKENETWKTFGEIKFQMLSMASTV